MAIESISNRYPEGWYVDLHPGTRIADNEDLSVREELIVPQGKYHAYARIDRACREFLEWHQRNEKMSVRVQDPEGEQIWIDSTHSYSAEYRSRYYFALKALEKYSIKAWDTAYTSLLTLTTSSRGDKPNYREPVDHLEELKASWDQNVRKRLHEILQGMRSAWALVLEPHSSGYAHMHIAVFHDKSINRMSWKRLIRAHVNNCEYAGKKAHQIQNSEFGEGVLTTRKREDDDQESITDYLGDYVGLTYEHVQDMDLPHLIFSTTLWATGTRRVRFSGQARAMIEQAQREGEWDQDTEGYVFLSIDLLDEEGKVEERFESPDRGGAEYISLREFVSKYKRKPP